MGCKADNRLQSKRETTEILTCAEPSLRSASSKILLTEGGARNQPLCHVSTRRLIKVCNRVTNWGGKRIWAIYLEILISVIRPEYLKQKHSGWQPYFSTDRLECYAHTPF